MSTDHAHTIMLLQSTRGAPLTCLIALLVLGGKGNGVQVAAATGYDEETARKSLTRCETLGLVARAGRYNWQILSQTATQLPLFVPSELSTGYPQITPYDNGDRGNPAFPLGGGVNTLTEDSVLTTTPPPPGDRGIPAFPPDEHAVVSQPNDAAEIADLLTARTGYPRQRALKAAQDALEQNYFPGFLKAQILRWTLYATSERTANAIHNVGAFVASKLRSGEQCPAWVKPEAWSEDEKQLRKYVAEWNAEQDADDTDDDADNEELPT